MQRTDYLMKDISIYVQDLKPVEAIKHAFKYGSITERFTTRKQAISRVNSFMGYCSRNDLNGTFKTELVTAINSKDEIVFYATLYKIQGNI